MLVRALMGLWFLFSLTGSAQAMDNPYRLLTSPELPEFFANTLPGFWQQHAQPGEFIGVDGVPIRYVALRNPVGHKAILVVNGRLESYIKYQELAYELFQQGYSVYLYDHRGQGFSGRMLSDPQKGYVQRFADYVTDLKSFHDQVVLADQPNQLYLLSHSMGGAIAAHYLEQYPQDVKAAVLSSPMFGIELGALPTWLARFITWLMEWFTQLLGIESPYAPSQGPYDARPFADNDLTHDAERYAQFRSVYRTYPEVQLGGPTTSWVHQALDFSAQAVAAGTRITTPVLVLQSGADTVVRNDQQQLFCQQMSAAHHPCAGDSPLTVAKARHELLNESDEFRIPALNATLDFFKQNP
jgi:lysophospholipase